MFVLIWTALLFCVRDVTADTGKSLKGLQTCGRGFCITLSEGEITAEAGLCVVIPCSFTLGAGYTHQHMVWFKCEPPKLRCGVEDIIFNTNKKTKVQSKFFGRVSLLEPDMMKRNCSIIINNLTESDSGFYQLRMYGILSLSDHGFAQYLREDGYTFSKGATVSVKALTQKPSVLIPPLTEGRKATLTCTAPGLCSGSDPEITWRWRGAGEKDSHITGNITGVTQRRSSTLTFNPSAEHHGTNVTCKVSFTSSITTEETETLNVASLVNTDQCGAGAALPWVIVAVVSLVVNVICIILLTLLWNTRKQVKPKQEDRTYTSLRKKDVSPEYDVIAQALN
ncbi:sialic acid-binding Ig-like lectin 8 [Pseudoliparis swirei]|uniref:sialic acid-binding Ig-like lectin 8 n=1 Tax=Pseudoliparis swirei TaxID=2059687 RepID=UPI0024BEB272|nr:sialic acid-binding Ig-like lectin 8 [Pseudoliparis swirei]